MAIPSRTARPGTYFITTATHDRRRLFQVERNAALLLETIDHYRASYLLHAYVAAEKVSFRNRQRTSGAKAPLQTECLRHG
jgi:hypothetical protein